MASSTNVSKKKANSRPSSSKKRRASSKKASRMDNNLVKRIKLARFLARKGITHEVPNSKRGNKKDSVPKPKRARSAYIFFCQDERPILKKELGDKQVKPIEIMGLLAERWNNCSAKTKKKYEKRANEDKERYEQAKEEAKAYEKPKRARGAYNFFVAHERPLMAEIYEQNKIFQEIGKKWKQLDDEAKADYIKMEEEDKTRHEKELAEWKKLKENKKKSA
eukprot:CAMPEP_0184504460 /NCGR_PEP_ID=MMETSP0113_2-20130426/52478_1 /TAXON_ID=91329 /ORGANISM="Norrisiella sphaerica, Strain BC52" /LENGTH=220 /DNA_ID=CAMNT_0026894107 /DNA_START=2054 /DNA_END=2716 /DNA_ORIENTATION=+